MTHLHGRAAERARKTHRRFHTVFRTEGDRHRMCLTDRATALAHSDREIEQGMRKTPLVTLPPGVGEIMHFWRVG